MSLLVMDSQIAQLNHESDYAKVRDVLPDKIARLEDLLLRDPQNAELHIYAANAYYVYAFGFVEDSSRQKASSLYYQGFMHARQALQHFGIHSELLNGPASQLEAAVARLDSDAIDALFFAALCWSKVIEMNAEQMLLVMQLPRTLLLMQRVHELDRHHRMAGPDIFFGIYYGSRPPLLGGNFNKSRQHFEQARTYNQDKLLLVDFLQARYLWLQMGDRQAFHDSLNRILRERDDLLPEQALLNSIARHRAAHWLKTLKAKV